MQHHKTASKPAGPLRVLAEALPLTLVLGLTVWWLLQRPGAEPQFGVELRPLAAADAAALQALLPAGYGWPPPRAIPALGVQRLPADLAGLDVVEKKQLFFRTLLPLILAENERIRHQRDWLQQQFTAGLPPADSERRASLRALAASYGISGDLADPAVQRRLLRRVDTLPPALALAQAANESGWGTSRFAVEANNLFGEWTYDPAKGLVPKRRSPGRNHLVRVFPDLRAAVRSYLHNLNTGRAYRGLRLRREAMRRAGQPLDPLALAEGLQRYSSRGQAYVREIKAMIRGNGLHRLGELSLQREESAL